MNTSVWRRRAWQAASLYEPLNLLAWIAAWLGLGLLALGYLLPRTVDAVEPLPWGVAGQWMYTATVPPAVAEDQRLPLGAPLYRPLTPQVDFTFTARVEAEVPPTAPQGRARLWARLADEYGWSRTWTLAERDLDAAAWQVTGTLDLGRIERLIRSREAVYPPARGYTLTVAVTWTWEAALAGEPWQHQATAALTFRREGEGFFVLQGPRTAPDAAATDLFAPRWSGTVERAVLRPRTVSLGPLRATVDQVRGWGLGLAVAGGVLLLASNAALGWVQSRWPEVYFRAWLGGHGVVLTPGPWLADWIAGAVPASPEALLSLAHKWGEPVLLVPTDDAVHLFVRLPEAVYHYAAPQQPHDEPAPADDAPAGDEPVPPDARPAEPEGVPQEDDDVGTA